MAKEGLSKKALKLVQGQLTIKVAPALASDVMPPPPSTPALPMDGETKSGAEDTGLGPVEVTNDTLDHGRGRAFEPITLY